MLIDGQDVTGWGEGRLRPLRRDLAMVFRDPYTCLNPRHSVARILAGPLMNHGMPHRRPQLAALLEATGLLPEHLDRFPHEFSGGQRQRIAIARALATDPRVIVADEPVSALDVSVRAQVLNLLTELQRERGLGLLVVSHDLSVVRTIADRVLVMYLGRVVEEGPTRQVYQRPQHPYTQALLAAIPVPDPHRRGTSVRIRGEISTSARPVAGCVFADRCPRVQQLCTDVTPVLQPPAPEPGSSRQVVACHFPGDDGGSPRSSAGVAAKESHEPG